jgi:antitoxin CptB
MKYDITNFKKRLIYRSQYRGTKEMDKLIGSFVAIYIDKLNDKDLKDLEEFLNIDDDSLYKFYNDQITLSNNLNTNIGKLFKNFKYKL